jgi:hypothetical protein
MATKIISARMDITDYEQVKQQCNQSKISVSDWIKLKIKHSDQTGEFKKFFLKRLRFMKYFQAGTENSTSWKEKVQRLIDFVESEL